MTSKHFTIQSGAMTNYVTALSEFLNENGKSHLLAIINAKTHLLKEDERGRYPLTLVTENINTIASITNEDNIGLKIINTAKLDNLPVFSTIKLLAYSLTNEHKPVPLKLLLLLMARYFSVISEAVKVDIIEYQHQIKIILTPNMPSQISMHQTEGAILVILRMLKYFHNVKPNSISLQHKQPNNTDQLYKNALGVIPKFSQFENLIELSSSETALEINHDTVSLLSTLQELMAHQFPELTFTQHCQHILKSILSLGEPKREHVSSILNMSISSLQRRLKYEGFSFKEILLSTRKQLSYEYLVSNNRTTSDTAFLLGYQSSGQFFKAFKIWFSMTPSEFQKKHNHESSS